MTARGFQVPPVTPLTPGDLFSPCASQTSVVHRQSIFVSALRLQVLLPPTASAPFSSSASMAGGRRSKPAPPPPPQKTLVVDNGASTIKAGFVTNSDDPSTLEPRIIPNCIARDRFKKIYVADELEKCKDFSDIQYRRPADRGYIVNWEAQREIWNRQFFDDKASLRCDPAETRLLLCEPPNNLPVLQTNCDQIVFEEYGFASYYRAVGM